MRRLIVSCSLLLALGAPAVAGAAPIDLGIKAAAVDVAMTSDGAAHVAWLGTAGGTPALKVCRIPANGATCVQTASLALPDDNVRGPWIVTDGTKVVVAAGDDNGAAERTYAAVSATGTGAYSPVSQVADITATDVALSPDGTRLWITAPTGPTGTANDYLAFTSAPLPSGSTTAAAVLGTASGGRTIGGQILGITPDGKPLAFESGNAPNLMPDGSYYRPFTGDSGVPAQLVDSSKWGAPVRYDLGDPFQRNGAYDVTSAPGRMWLAYEGLGRDSVLRPYVNGGFGPAVTPDCTTSRFAAGLQEAPDVAITRTGALLITEVGSDGTNQHLGFFLGRPDGSGFSPYQELAAGPRIQDVETAADPTGDAAGVAVWTSDDIYADQGEVSFTRLPAATVAACPSSTPPPSPGPTPTPAPTPILAPKPTPPAPKRTKTINVRLGGATLTLTAPNACVAAGKSYTLKLTSKITKKGTVLRIAKVVFTTTGAKDHTDRKAPFTATRKVKKATKKVTIKAKAYVTLGHHRRTTTIRTTLSVC